MSSVTFQRGTRRARQIAFAGFVVMVAACGGGEEAEPAAEGMGDMPGMSGSEAGPMEDMGGRMIEDMRVQLDRMANLPVDSLMATLPTHRQMVANMLAEMNREMREMSMGADSAWTATVDSLRADLVRMPQVRAEEVSTFMSTHRERVTRLMSMHATMMGGMRM
jgi:hypothetical protein